MLIDSPDWVNVVAVVTNASGEDCFVLARQYRHGCSCLTLEFPGGVVDEGEQPVVSALREFEEETGYTAGRLTCLGSINPNPAYMTNEVHTFLAHDVRKKQPQRGDHRKGDHQKGGQKLDPDEIIDVCLLPVAEIETTPEFLRHAIMVVALHWYRRSQQAAH